MEANTGKQEENLKVLRPASYIPLEIWGAQVNGIDIYERNYDFKLVQQAVTNLFYGDCLFKNNTPLSNSEIVRGFKHVYYLGGRFTSQKIPIGNMKGYSENIAISPQWAGVRGLKRISSFYGYSSPLFIDWGQCYVKIQFKNKQEIIERDIQKFPILKPGVDSRIYSLSLREYYLNMISRFDTDAIFLALPVEIYNDDFAASCSIAGLGYNLKEVFTVKNLPVYIVNDAIAAAYSLSLEKKNQKSLVITLGFAMGGALFYPQ